MNIMVPHFIGHDHEKWGLMKKDLLVFCMVLV